MYCPKCQAPLPEPIPRFCNNCGMDLAPLQAMAQAAPQAYAPNQKPLDPTVQYAPNQAPVNSTPRYAPNQAPMNPTAQYAPNQAPLNPTAQYAQYRAQTEPPRQQAGNVEEKRPSGDKKILRIVLAAVLSCAILAGLIIGGITLLRNNSSGSGSARKNRDREEENDVVETKDGNGANEGTSQEEGGGPDSGNETPVNNTADMRVALITDYGDINDESFNQAAYEGAKNWCDAYMVSFSYYKPAGDSDEDRTAAIEKAIGDGYNVLVLPGYVFAYSVPGIVEKYPDVKFILLDCSEYDLQAGAHPGDWDFDFDWEYPSNLYSAVYREEVAGYMAGFAAVKLGYEKIGYLGGMAVPAVVRYGYGFVQGVNDAARELNKTDRVEVRYVYGNQFYGDADITAYMDAWYAAGTEVVFACGGGIYFSAAEAAKKVNGKVIGVDVDQAPTIDGWYGAGMTVTSAMKGYGASVGALLQRIADDKFEGGKVETLGLVSETPNENYVQLPESTQWNSGFTWADYCTLVSRLYRGEISVSDSVEPPPSVDIFVSYEGNIH